jgi:prevent-host-death family protein
MTEVGIRALKQNASAVVAKVASGDAVTITDRGRPVAQMVPLTSGTVETLMTNDRMRSARRRLSDLPPPARRKRDAVPLSQALDEMRRSERS